jgi:hypothetical protein
MSENNNVLKISGKITGFQVQRKDIAEDAVAAKPKEAPVTEVTPVTTPKVKEILKVAPIHMNEHVARPEALHGTTYKIKTPVSDHALYITINDIVLNAGTEHEQRRPFEIFINSKNMDHYMWVVALTRIVSAIFRKGGDVAFLVEELKAIFDPRGGYWQPGGRFMPSLVAELGCVIERHLQMLGLVAINELDDNQKALVAAKLAQYETRQASAVAAAKSEAVPSGETSFPDNARMCPKCHTKAVILMDGCLTCLNCADSKCG